MLGSIFSGLISIVPVIIKTIFQLWKSSSEFSAMRSLTMVSLAQRLISLSHSSSAASRYSACYINRKGGRGPHTNNLFIFIKNLKPHLAFRFSVEETLLFTELIWERCF